MRDNELLQNPEMHPLRGKFLEIARGYYKGFVDKHQDNPELRKDLAEAYRRLGDIGWTLGDEGAGDEGHSRALSILEQLVADNPDNDEIRHDSAATFLAVALEEHSGREANLRKAIELARDLRKPAHRNTLGTAYLQLGNYLMCEYAWNSGTVAHRDEAIASAGQAQKLFESLHEQDPDAADYELGLSEVFALMSWRYSLEGNRTQSDEYEERSITILQRVVDEYPENVEYRRRLADLLGNSGKHEPAIEILSKLVEAHPANLKYQEMLIENYRALGRERRDAADRAVAAATALAERYPQNIPYRAKLGICLATQAEAEQRDGDIDQAITSYQAAIASLESVKPYSVGNLSDAYLGLCDVAEVRGDLNAAIAAMEKAIEISVQTQEMNPDNLRFFAVGVSRRLKLATLLRESGRHSEALAACQAAGNLLSGRLPEDETLDAPMTSVFYIRSVTRDYYRELGVCLETLGRHGDAVDAFRQAIAAETQIVRDVPRSWVHESPNPLYASYITACCRTDRVADVESTLREELETWRELEERSAISGSCQIRQLEIQLRLAEHLLSSDRVQEAAEFYRKVLSYIELEHQGKGLVHVIAVCAHVCPAWPQSTLPASNECAEVLTAIAERFPAALAFVREHEPQSDEVEQRRWDFWSEIALAYHRPRGWQGAEEDARLVINLEGATPERLAKFAPLLLLAGNQDEYRAFCQQLLNDCRDSHSKAPLTVLGLCLLESQPPNMKELLFLARESSEGLGDQHLVHVAQYRSGQCEAAFEGLNDDLTAGFEPIALIELHLAVAHHLAGDSSEARSWLRKANDDRTTVCKPQDKIVFEILKQEIEAATAGATRSDTDTSEVE